MVKIFFCYLKLDIANLREIESEIMSISIKGRTLKSLKEETKKRLIMLCNEYLSLFAGDERVREELRVIYRDTQRMAPLFSLSLIDCVYGEKEEFEIKRKIILATKTQIGSSNPAFIF